MRPVNRIFIGISLLLTGFRLAYTFEFEPQYEQLAEGGIPVQQISGWVADDANISLGILLPNGWHVVKRDGISLIRHDAPQSGEMIVFSQRIEGPKFLETPMTAETQHAWESLIAKQLPGEATDIQRTLFIEEFGNLLGSVVFALQFTYSMADQTYERLFVIWRHKDFAVIFAYWNQTEFFPGSLHDFRKLIYSTFIAR